MSAFCFTPVLPILKVWRYTRGHGEIFRGRWWGTAAWFGSDGWSGRYLFWCQEPKSLSFINGDVSTWWPWIFGKFVRSNCLVVKTQNFMNVHANSGWVSKDQILCLKLCSFHPSPTKIPRFPKKSDLEAAWTHNSSPFFPHGQDAKKLGSVCPVKLFGVCVWVCVCVQ